MKVQKILLKSLKALLKRHPNKCRHLLIGMCIVLSMWGFGLSFCINVSDSLPQRFFVLTTHPNNVQRGAYVVFNHTIKDKKTRLLKQVQGVAGDVIRAEGNRLFINGHYIAMAKSHSEAGLPLSPILPGIIPKGYLFVQGTHPDSFDSRYEAFGLLPLSHVLARAYPLF
ncbi:MAG TPA: S26 family signal peptidase [Gammaproteobacteria bacterium]|nr:S26 family signal peptidase [Gammaproteobacteria bacterium]